MGPIVWFSELSLERVAEVGGKNASLGELVRELVPLGVRVPDGFALVADAFRAFLREGQLEDPIRRLLGDLDLDDVAGLQRKGMLVRQAILSAPLSQELAEATLAAYARLSHGVEEGVDVAVRSSATAEDLPEASFAGQQETWLNVRGRAALLEAVRKCYASLYTDRAISYRAERGYGQLDVALSVGVQRMVRADLGCAGVMFTLDTESGFRDVVLVSAAYGLGENVVQGTVVPDEYTVFKPTLKQGHRPLVRRVLGSKELRMVYDEGGGRGTRNEPVPADQRSRFALTEDEVLELARQACLVEEHYSKRRGAPCPMDLEWAKDGRTGELFVLQARPETVHAQKKALHLERFHLLQEGVRVVSGRAIGERIASGTARLVRGVEDLASFQDGEILVAERTDPDWEPVMRKAAAIVTERGGRTCHAAIVSRELGIPAVVGAVGAMSQLRPGQPYTVVCAQGETGWVLEGQLPFQVEHIELSELARPQTRVMMNVADPAEALHLAQLPNDGVGLLREEFVINHAIGIHPMALVDTPKLPPALRAEIERRIAPWTDGRTFFVDKLAEGVGTIAAAFWPKDVIVRLSDFKTNEYAQLLGGAPYEPREENPMLGFRGASRYADARYREAFALECQALCKVRDQMGLTNVKVMVPFVRTVPEAQRVLEEMGKHGLVRGQHGLEVYAMCEIPSNVVLIEEFSRVFDGFSIGSNDLTQLVLGVDRDSEILAELFDERDPAVLWAIGRAIEGAHRAGRKIGICGQAPSDHPEFAELLVRLGIDSISLNPDTVLLGTRRILAAEQAVARAPAQDGVPLH
jgi:pyruvate,water dikinase